VLAWKVGRFVGTAAFRRHANHSTPYNEEHANIFSSIALAVTGIELERIGPKCLDKIKQSHPVGGKDQAEEKEPEEAEAEVGAAVAEQARAETAFVRPAERRPLIKPEFLASTRSALNAEHLWHGSSHGSM